MTTTVPPLGVPLPAGAISISTFQEWENLYRIVYTPDVFLPGPGARVTVYASALQLPDGSVDGGSLYEPPKVWLDYDGGNEGMTVAQARDAAAAIVAACDAVDGWVAK